MTGGTSTRLVTLSRRPRGLSPHASRCLNELNSSLRVAERSGDYDMAKTLFESERVLREEEEVRLEKQESDRQRNEVERMREALERKRHVEEGKWKGRERSVEDSIAAKMNAMEESHRYQREKLEEEIQAYEEAHSRVAYSCKYIEMKNTHDQLVRFRKFDEAKEVKRRLDLMEEEEEKRHNRTIARTVRARRDRLARKQESECTLMKQLVATLRLKALEEIENDRKLLDQNTCILTENMRHAHKMEFLSRPIPQMVAEHSKRTSLSKSATFLGSNLLASCSGNSYALPSLCELEPNL